MNRLEMRFKEKQNIKVLLIMILSFVLQSAGDSSMSSGSLGDRRSDSPEFRSLSPQGILSFGILFTMAKKTLS